MYIPESTQSVGQDLKQMSSLGTNLSAFRHLLIGSEGPCVPWRTQLTL